MHSFRQQTISLTALCLGFFMVIMDVTIVNVALPTIAAGLQTRVAGLQWIVAGYTLTFAGFLLFSGHLADQVGAKKTLMGGLIGFVITSLACGLAHSIGLLILLRLLQGITAAMLVSSSLALINASYPDKPSRAKAIGVWGMMGGIAAASGPVLGALLTAAFGWRAVFIVNVPIGLLAIFLVLTYVINPRQSGHNHFDLLGQMLGIIATASLAFLLIEAGRDSWLSMLVLTAGLVFILSFALFLMVETYVRHPMFPLHFFKNRNFSIAIIIGMLINLGMYGELFILPLYFQHIRGYSVLMTGCAIFPLVMLIALSSYLAGKLASQKGTKLPLSIGLIVAMCGFFGLLIVVVHSASYYWLVLPLAAMGFGVAFIMPAATITTIQAVPAERAGLAGGAFNTSRQIGSLIGVALFGAIVASAPHFMQGMHLTLIIAGLLFLCGFLLSRFVET